MTVRIILLAICFALLPLAGCSTSGPDVGSEEELGLKEHASLQELIGYLEYSADLLYDRFDTERYGDAVRLSNNISVYCRHLRWYEPEDRPYASVKKFDTYGKSLAARADVAGWFAHNHKRIQGAHEAKAIIEYVAVLKTFLAPATGFEGEIYEERVEPQPLDQPNPREAVPDSFSRRVNPTD